ncbi:hypothetical protein QZH41_012419, partial [Actinostola sp. cb2023]
SVTMVIVTCSVPDCEFQSEDVSEVLAIALLTNHGLAHQNSAPQPKNTALRGPKLERPKVDIGISVEEWNIFKRRWEVFRAGSGIDDSSAPSQLFQCAGNELGDNLLKANPNATTEPLHQLMAAIRSLAVIPVATSVLRTELLRLHQERDEPVRAFAAKVRGKAETCAFATKCPCGSIYRPSGARQTREQPPPPPRTDQAKDIKCPECHTTFKIFTEGSRGWNTTPHQLCITCYRERHRRKRQQRLPQQRSPQSPSSAVQAVESDSISQVAALHTDHPRASCHSRRRRRKPTYTTHGTVSKPSVPRLAHHIFTKGGWRQARLRDHPTVPLTISIARPSRAGNHTCGNAPVIQVEVPAIADTGAQSDLWSLDSYLACGFPLDGLQPISLSLSAANRSPISIEGAFFDKLATKSHSGEIATCHSMVYVSSSVKSMYLSYESLLNLGLLPHTFPSIDDDVNQQRAPRTAPSVNATREINDGYSTHHDAHDVPCPCLLRQVAPQRPTKLPFPCIPENNVRMKAWLLEHYAASTFNTCPHRALPCMEGPAVEIHLDPTATPKASHTPANVPIHWQQRVYDDLFRDEALGVIERVPYGEPVTWCHRMIITRKHDGTPRRTVDLSPLNKFCQRETFAMESPFHLVRRIPKNT